MRVTLKADDRPVQSIRAETVGITTTGPGTVVVQASGDGSSSVTTVELPGGGSRTDIRNGDGSSTTILRNPAAGNGTSTTVTHTDDGQGTTTTTTTTTDSNGNVSSTTVTNTPG
jgi:hypothetical protein